MTQPKPWVVLVGTLALMLLLLAAAQALTKNRIEKTEQREFLSALEELISAAPNMTHYDNNPSEDMILVSAQSLGEPNPHRLYRLRLQEQPLAVVIENVTPEGYNGDIEMLVAIEAKTGTLLGVRVTRHLETPGLGDDIEIKRSPWITQFDGLSLLNVAQDGWTVKKEGGAFDQLTGATITSRAVIHSVQRTLIWYAENKQSVFTEKSGTLVDG